jgi:hypothetical protein
MPHTHTESFEVHPAWAPLEQAEGVQAIAPLYFGAATFQKAQGPAREYLVRAALCERCRRGLAQMHARLGAEFFRDDDPRELLRVFEPEDRNSCVLHILAAYIVVHGQKRAVTMH